MCIFTLLTFSIKYAGSFEDEFDPLRALFRLAVDVGEGKWSQNGIPKGEVSTEEHLQVAVSLMRSHYLPKVKLEELYMADVEALTGQFEKRLRCAGQPGKCGAAAGQKQELKLIQDSGFRRLRCSVDLDLAVRIFNADHNDIFDGDEEGRIARCRSAFKAKVEHLNDDAAAKREIRQQRLSCCLSVCLSIVIFALQSTTTWIRLSTMLYSAPGTTESLPTAPGSKSVPRESPW